MQSSALKNRILKNFKKIKPYITKNNIEAYRIYNKDIPEYPYLIDIYKNNCVIYEQGKNLSDEDLEIKASHQSEISEAISDLFNISKSNQFFKTREKQKGSEQYKPLQPKSDNFFTINEGGLSFLINLERYLDTGLFLDHRPLRQFLTQNSLDKKVLNLFCYTGSLSVAAAKGGGTVTSVDLSSTYLDWAVENFRINNLDPKSHRFVKADILKKLSDPSIVEEKYDLILLDPPSFSNSKSMEDDLDVLRDHPFLIDKCMKILSPGGELYFSTNKKKFQLAPELEKFQVKEITHWTIPQDFHHTNIHKSYVIKHKQN